MNFPLSFIGDKMASFGVGNVRYEWYQTDTLVVVTVLTRNVKTKNFNVNIGETTISFTSQFENAEDFDLHLNLAHNVLPSQSSWKPFTSKVEIKLKKAEGIRWNSLERSTDATEQPNPVIAQIASFSLGSSQQATRDYPSSSAQKRDWDKIVTDISKVEEEEEKNLSGEAAVNSLFQKIYSDGSEEVRRAMNKSFMESGGTVLSTNWKEVGKETVTVKPPEGMEFKKWEQ